MTKTYNRFHDPTEYDTGIVKLRELHAELDRATLHAYGWSDISSRYEFVPEHENPDDAESGRKKRRCRYRWPDDLREEVLTRLLALNSERAQEERRLSGED